MLPLSEPSAAAPADRTFALWRLGFSPFYWAAAVFAALSVPVWALQYAGGWPTVLVPGVLWHAHEMPFGFVLAVIVGFLFTAGRNWSNEATPSGWPLALPFWRARNQRNYFFVALLAGRVVPMFTNNALPGAGASRDPRIEKAALGSVLVLVAIDLLPGVPPWLAVAVALVAAVAHALRWWCWQPWLTRHTPILWVLHLAYAWVPVHLLLRAAATLGWIAPSLATHALTVGAIGG